MTKQEKALQLKWYKRLRKEGFIDIEAPIHKFTESPQNTWYFEKRYDEVDITTRRRYYELAAQLVYEYPFRSAKEKRVWQLHSDGLSFDNIAIKVKSTHGSVASIVKRIAACIKS